MTTFLGTEPPLHHLSSLWTSSILCSSDEIRLSQRDVAAPSRSDNICNMTNTPSKCVVSMRPKKTSA